MASKGFFLVLEGIDGSGKTTIARLLAKKLKAWSTKEPSTALQKKIEAARSKLSVLDMQKLYIAERAVHTKKIRAALTKDRVVICQRYALSTFAYGTAFGVPLSKLKHSFLAPDLTIFLDIPATLAMQRITARKQEPEYFEKQEKLAKIRRQYLKLAHTHKVIVIDGRSKPEIIAKKILWHMK